MSIDTPQNSYDWDHLIRPEKVHRSVYTDADIFELEMVKLFGGVWTYLGHESELPTPDAFKRVRMGYRPLILTRDRDGGFNALFNRCAHRAALICSEPQGRAARFMCPYHGWTYNNQGKLVGVPFANLYGDDFEKGKHPLSRVPRVESYRGFIFGTLNPDMPPLKTYLGLTTEYLDAFIDRAPNKSITVRAGAYRGVFHGNWKLAWDNAADGYHVTFAHRSLVEMTRIRSGKSAGASYMGDDPDLSPMYCKQFPHGHTLLHHRPGMGPKIWSRARPTPGTEAYQTQLVNRLGEDAALDALEGAPGFGMNLNIFPNLMIIANQIQVVEPQGYDKTQLTWYATTLDGAEPEVNKLRLRIAEDFPNFGEVDDLEMFERCWEGLKTPEIEWINTHRGLHRPDSEILDEHGVRTVTSTDEAPLRGYLQAYREYMKQEMNLAAV